MIENKHRCTELWNSFRRGEETAFRALYELSYPHLYRYGYSLLGDETRVRDALQDVYLSLYTRAGRQQREIERIWVYLFTSLRNRLVDERRRERPYFPLEAVPATTPSIEEEVVNAEDLLHRQRWLQQLLDRLPRRQSEAIQLRYYQELDYPDIAEIMNVNVQVAYNYVSRGLTSLRDQARDGSA